MKILDQLAEYLYLKKRDPSEKPSQWTKYMHGMNRISLMMFLVGLVVIVLKIAFRHPQLPR